MYPFSQYKTRYDRLINVLALYRPGPREFIEEFNERRHGKKVDYIDDSLKGILSSTYGIIVYQEQILQVAYNFAGLSLAKADILRRAMSKKDKDKMMSLKKEFIDSSINNGKSEEKANEVVAALPWVKKVSVTMSAQPAKPAPEAAAPAQPAAPAPARPAPTYRRQMPEPWSNMSSSQNKKD